MGILSRIIEVTESKVNKILNRLEDPNELLDLSYEKMLSGLQEVRSHIADVATEKKRLENQISKCRANIAQKESEAKAALRLGKEDLASRALEIKQEELQKIEEYDRCRAQISVQLDKLIQAENKFKERIEQFRHQKEVSKATYQASSAQVKINEYLSGVGDKLGNVNSTLQRAQDKSEQMTARASALNDMLESGVVNDALGDADSIQHELAQVAKQSAVQEELMKLKESLKD